MLKWNAQKVRNLTPAEVWLFILGRVLVAFAIGVFADAYFPRFARTLALPALVVGTVLFGIAIKGLARKNSSEASA